MHLSHNNNHLYRKTNLKSSSVSPLCLINIRQWREARNLQIQRREEISQKKKQEIVEQAKQAIDDFYENYNNQKEKAIAQTRYLLSSPASEWEIGKKSPNILRLEMKVLVEPRGKELPSMWIFLKRVQRVVDLLDIASFYSP